MLATLSIVLLAIGAHAQDCGEEFKTVTECMTGGIKGIMDEMPLAKIDEEAIETDMLACFTDSGCMDIKALEEQMGSGSSSHSDSHEMMMPFGGPPSPDRMAKKLAPVADLLGLDMEDMKEVVKAGMQCARDMKPTVLPKINTCLQAAAPELASFELPLPPPPPPAPTDGSSPPPPPPDMDASGPVGAVLGFLGMMHHHMNEAKHDLKGLFWAMEQPFVCDSVEKKQAVATCLIAAEKKHMPEELSCTSMMKMMLHFVKTKDNLCAARNNCMSAMTEPCAAAHKQLPKHVCGCARDFLKAEWDSITEDMTSCINEKVTKQVTLPPMMVKGPMKAMALRMLDEQCKMGEEIENVEEFDPCKPGFPLFEFFKPRHSGSGSHSGSHEGGNFGPKGFFKGMPKGGPPKGGPPKGAPLPELADAAEA